MVNLTEEDLIEIVRLSTQDGLSSRKIAQIFGCGKSTINDFLAESSHREFWDKHRDKPIADGRKVPMHKERKHIKGDRFVLFAAQNNTYVHNEFLESLKVFAKKNNARMICGTYHYNKNAYSKSDKQDDKCWFDPKIQEYILDQDVYLAKDLLWCGSLDIIPTAINPMSGFHSYTGTASGIFPHAKLQLESKPVSKFDDPKIFYTTGTVTQYNYIQRKSGQKAEFHHTFGAVYVEVDKDGDWFVRQLNAESNTGCFYDLDTYYTPEGFTSQNRIEAVNWGDLHLAKKDSVVAEASWGDNDSSILNTLKPKYQFLHDTFDMSYRNHHNINNPHFRFQQYVANQESVEQEVLDAVRNVLGMTRDYSSVIVVHSNHDEALERWLVEQDYKKDPVNAIFYLEMQLAKYKAIAEASNFHTFEHAFKTVAKKNNLWNVKLRFLRKDESFVIAGDIECGQHGHLGNNGARGSMRAFQMQGKKYNTGHTHSAAIKDGVFTAGVSGLMDQNYNSGGSSWNQSHILTYANGKRTIITLKNGKWRA